MKCPYCKIEMVEKEGKNQDGVSYAYHCCPRCKEELLDMRQLHEVAEKYRRLKKYSAKLSRWGSSIAVRIPSPLVKANHLKVGQELFFIQEKKAIKILA